MKFGSKQLFFFEGRGRGEEEEDRRHGRRLWANAPAPPFVIWHHFRRL